jgi:hypothetical protein
MDPNKADAEMSNFSIQNTMEMGAGNPELLNNLMAPETTTTDPNEVKEIIEKADPLPGDLKPVVKPGAEIIPTKDLEEKPNTSIADFLHGDDADIDKEANLDPAAVEKADPEAPDPEAPEGEGEGEGKGTQFGALANDLYELGVFTKTEGEEDSPITSPEGFLEKFNAEKQKGAIEVVDNFIGQFGDDYQKAFNAIFVKGADPKEYFSAMDTITNFAELDMANEGNQEKVLQKALTDQGFEPEDVTTEIERLKNYGDLESVSKKHHKVLIKKESATLQNIEAKAAEDLQNKASIKNEYITNVQTIIQDKLKTREFDGIPINPKIATELQDFLLTDKYKTASGETLTDFDRAILEMKRPENHATKVKVGLLLKMLEKDPTLSTIQKKGVSKKSDKLFGSLARQVVADKKQASPKTVPKSWFK